MSNNKEILQTSISLILAASVAHALFLIATSVPVYNSLLWILSTITIIFIAICLLFYVLGFSPKPNTDIDYILAFKIILIALVSIDIFAFSRFIYFFKNLEIPSTDIEGIYQMVWYIAIGTGIILMLLSLFDYRNNKNVYRLIVILALSAIIFLISGFLIAFTNDFLMLRGVIP